MPDDPATSPRRAAVAAAGHRGDVATAREALGDPDPDVRAAALGALARLGRLHGGEVVTALGDPSATVRRRAATESVGVRAKSVEAALLGVLGDAEPLVAEAACWALGERGSHPAVPELARICTTHPDPRCREAAVAALGAIGDPAGLAGVLGALDDRPPVRRRAAVALAAFEGPEVDAALRRCLADHDWQVRQVAEILLD